MSGETTELVANPAHPINERIVQDPKIMAGKPVIRGTRIPVERIIPDLATNPSLDDLFAAYPELIIEDVKAALAFARGALSE